MNAKLASIALVTLTLCLPAAGVPTLAQQSGKPPAPAAGAKPAHSASPAKVARQKGGADLPAAVGTIPDAQRLAVQADIVWLGGFDDLSAEEFDKHMAEAIRAFQRRNGGKDTGAPRPPAPTTSTRARPSAACPGPPTSRSTMWRA